jgi:uncharacterized damage-inducible protein DinB
MASEMRSLQAVFDGWQGHQASLVNAIASLSPGQLRWKPAPNANSIGEIARHISLGRVTWFHRMRAPGSAEVTSLISAWEIDDDGNRNIVEGALPIVDQASELVRWLNLTWQMIETTLKTWDVDDLARTYRHKWNGQTYAVSRQWTLWRILTHDVHHGGELSLMLGLQGIEAFELSTLFGHITLPPLADD